jgi:transcriptional regulator with XRE-family HTH domain
MLTGAQIHAARTLLRLPLRRLAESTGLPASVILAAERASEERLNPIAERLIRKAFEGAGIEFTSDGSPGLKLDGSGSQDDDRR